jgi:hypothetical protein
MSLDSFLLIKKVMLVPYLLQNVYVPKMNQIEMEQLSFVDYKCDEE